MMSEREQQKQLAQAFQGMPRDQADDLKKSIKSIVEENINQLLPSAIDGLLERVGYNEEVAGLVRLLAARSNDSKDEVLRKALTLYGLALDALEKGNRMAILDPDDVIIHEVIGLAPRHGSRQEVAR